MSLRTANQPLQATAPAPSVFSGLENSLLLLFVVAQVPAAVPELMRSAEVYAKLA
jgi:hypothetical protein